MGLSYTETRYSINGLIATEDTVLNNLEKLCNAAGAWLTYDIHAGKWSVIINKSGTSTDSFDDSNIIGPISINGTGLDSLYNKVTVTFPHEDLRDQRDVISIEIPPEDRNANEPDNTLNITYDIVTNPVQAELLGFLELKQSRVDKIVTFRTDYSKISVKAGDIIDITSTVYGFVGKMFRVITVREVDTDEGGIDIEITALEYDSSVYDTSNLARYTRTTSTGITAIGAIAAPDQPTVTTYSNIARPHITAVSQLNSGLADAVEFWITYDVPPGVTLDENRTYTLLGTVNPENSTTFSAGEEVTLSIDSLSTSNFLIKARAKNSNAVSPFSDPSGQVYYAPVQTTDNINDSTTVNGGLLTAVGIATLLSELGSYYDEEFGLSLPGSGGAGDGTTFLLLDIENFNSNATTGGLYPGTGSIFMPVVRIVPPGVPSTVEGIDQTNFGQCFVGYGPRFTPGGPLYMFGNDPTFIGSGFTVSTPDHWPKYYPRKIMQRIGVTDLNYGYDIHRFGVDLGSYKLYYPDATEIKIEFRGYWQLEDQVDGRQYVDYSLSETAPDNSNWQPSTVGTAPIRVAARAYTGAIKGNITHPGLISPGGLITLGNADLGTTTYATQGIGYSSNVIVYDSVYPEQLGSNVALASVGQHITTFTYDLTEIYQRAPSFSAFNFSTPISETVQIPTGWIVNTESNVIVNVAPESYVTVTSIPTSIGTTFAANSTASPVGATIWIKATEFEGNVYSGSYFGGCPSRVAFPGVRQVATQANVFQHDFVSSQSQYATGIGIDGLAAGIGEWWNVHIPINQGSIQSVIVTDEYSEPASQLVLYSNAAKISNTSTAFVPVTRILNDDVPESTYYVSQYWGQLQANANVSPLDPEDFNAFGYTSSGQYYDVTGDDAFPYDNSFHGYEFGFFYNDQNSAINHVVLTDYGIDPDGGIGAWLKGNISS